MAHEDGSPPSLREWDNLAITERSFGSRISIHVRPRSSRSAILGVREGVLEVSLTSPPADGGVSRRVRAAVNRLLRQRELSADRAAALLTGHPADVVAALRRCGDDDSLPGTADLRGTTSVAFVPMALPVRPTPHGGFRSDPPPTHPALAERTENLARVAARLAAGPRVG